MQEYANKLKMDGLAKHSITGILSVFGAALDYAVEPLHYLPATPMRYVKYPKVEKKPRERIIQTLEEWQRISEAFALTWDDLDLENRTLTVNRQIVKRNFGADSKRSLLFSPLFMLSVDFALNRWQIGGKLPVSTPSKPSKILILCGLRPQ